MRNLPAFQRIQQRNAQYHISRYTLHEQAIREHIQRGFVDPSREQCLDEIALLDQRNKI